MATGPDGHEIPEGQDFCGECGAPLVVRTAHPSGKREHNALAAKAEAEVVNADARADAAHAHVEALPRRTVEPSTDAGQVGGRRQGSSLSAGGDTLGAPTGYVNAGPSYLRNLIAGIAASVGVIVGSIGTWASVLAFTKNAIGSDGTYTLVFGAASGIGLFTLLNLSRSNAGLRWLAPIAWSVSVVALLCLLIAITDIVDVLSAPTTDVFGVTIRAQVEWGLWMVAISSAALFVTASVVAVQLRRALRSTTA